MLGKVIIHLGDSAPPGGGVLGSELAGRAGVLRSEFWVGHRLEAELARVTRGLRVSGLRVGEGEHHSRSWWHAVCIVSPELSVSVRVRLCQVVQWKRGGRLLSRPPLGFRQAETSLS